MTELRTFDERVATEPIVCVDLIATPKPKPKKHITHTRGRPWTRLFVFCFVVPVPFPRKRVREQLREFEKKIQGLCETYVPEGYLLSHDRF